MAFGKKMNLKRRKKKSLAQQSKQILILMTVILVIILGGCTYVLNKTSGQIYEQMSQMAQLYAQELDNRFLRISRNLFSAIMDTNETNSTFYGNVNLMKNGDYSEYAIGKLREEYFSSAWEYGTEYRIFYIQTIRINYISFPCLLMEITQCHPRLQRLSVSR